MNSSVAPSHTFDFITLEQLLAASATRADLYKNIVNAPFQFELACAKLHLGIMVYLEVNKIAGLIERVALTKNYLAENTKRVSAKKFEEIKIPINHKDNVIAQAIETGTPQQTSDWKFLFTPALSASEARMNQASGGIATSIVYPVQTSSVKAAMIFSYYQYPHNVGSEQHAFMKDYIRLVEKQLSRF